MKVFLVPNYRKNEAVESGLSLELWLGRQGYEVAWAADQRSGITATPDIEGSDLVISLGGDGTLLRAARIVGYQEIPILGLSYGHVGFLTAASPDERDVLGVVADALAGEMHVSRRATLSVEVYAHDSMGGEAALETFALNDVALTRGPLSDMVEFDMTVSGHHIDRLRGDGVVVSTATGSTGYALSAGAAYRKPRLHGHGLRSHRPAHHPSARLPHLTFRRRRDLDVARPSLGTRDRRRWAVHGQRHAGRSYRGAQGPGDVLLLDYGPESFYNSVSRVFYGVHHDR